jgi:hypothetical protein
MNFPVQRFNEEFQKALEAKQFPAEKLSLTWWNWAFSALLFTSIIKLGINPEDWMNLIEARTQRKLTLYQFALLSNNLQERTPKELQVDILEYADIMAEADRYVKIWQEQSNSLREEVTKKVQEEQQMKEAAANGVGNILKPVKAEA